MSRRKVAFGQPGQPLLEAPVTISTCVRPWAFLWNAGDAVAKILATEAPLGFYKGALSHYARLGPHLVLVFLVLERLRVVVP